jgi:hypothetical protein
VKIIFNLLLASSKETMSPATSVPLRADRRSRSGGLEPPLAHRRNRDSAIVLDRDLPRPAPERRMPDTFLNPPAAAQV